MLYITYKILTYYSGVYKIMKIGHFTTNPQTQAKAASLSSEDTGLKAYMQKIYGYMTVGLAITGLVAWLISGASVNPDGTLSGLGQLLFQSPLGFIFMLAPLGLVMLLSFRIQRMQASTAQTMFCILSCCICISLASLFLAFRGESVS